MSGFGSGFGSQQPPPFGTPAPPPNNPPQQQQFGSGFGSATQSSGGFNNPGFGVSNSNFGGGFNSQQQQTNTSPFGGAGTSSFAAGNNTQFGNAVAGGTPQFGTSPNQPAFGTSSTFNAPQQATGGFGSTPVGAAQAPFGQSQPTSTPAQTPFGQAQATSSTSSFGNSNTATTSFGAASGGFGAATPATPFGSSAAAPAPSSGISFGVSSNVAPTSQGFGAATTSTPFSNASSGFGNNTPSNPSPAFGVSASTSFAPSSSAFGDPSSDYNDDNMMDGGGGGAMSAGTTPFGSSTTSSSPWTTGAQSSSNNARVSSPQPTPSNSGMQQQEDSSMSPIPSSISTSTSTKQQDELALLKAKKEKLLRKKKKLEELKRRKEAAAPVPSSSLNAGAPSFVPNEIRSAAPVDTETQSLADRNAARFAKPDTSDDLLPQELRNRQGAVASGYKDDGDDEALDIDNAVSLVGTCPYMCPDDELIRRQREGDIQLLETPQPGTIHPSDWTLRNTAVKRFRRSAADYKLNVPAWVRPPDVLETVCGYLEEWVMERDRQGPDPRFPQAESPPPLDVYQFIWDRTRMIRKDFILQNYVGTGGNCDARAVRCHERIARWHAMCEHQLSHIPEFVTAQSQQNMQEFGQAMKTLNMYYDDSMGRSTVEVPDEDGNETRTDLSGTTHGCTNEIVMGVNPVDFDGTPLENDAANVSKRLIGPQAVNSPAHGTAEPEMSGLYILTTMNNDGGMEVLKYASHLHRNRPEIHNSKPVQLAMRIFKARKDHNYAKFFSLLRDPETPYLFACIMFKQVEEMRMYALYTMSRTYGGVVKKTKQSVDDQYPLRRLVRLLCFEDASEALATCRHYNITVEESASTNPNSPSRSEAIIYWKRSSFRRPKDPEKGFTLTLPPRKMIRTIEAKLNGATRLAVCRGEVSGDGAALSNVSAPRPSARAAGAVPQQQLAVPAAVSPVPQEAETPLTDEQAAKRRVEERRRLREEQKRKDEERRLKEEAERKQREEAERQALILRKQKEEESKREQARAEEELKRKKAEEERIRQEQLRREAEAAAKEEQLRREAEERRLAAERAEAKRKAEAERLEMLRQAELQRKREEEERLERIRREKEEKRRLEEERIRQEQERLRQEQLRLQREREEQERRRREEEARRIAAAKEAKMNQARKLLIWRRLRSKLEGELRKERTRRSLSRLDPTFSGSLPAPVILGSDATGMTETNETDIDARADLLPGISVLDSLSRQSNGPLHLPAMLRSALYSLQRNAPSLAGSGDVMLTKVAVVLPTFEGSKADAMRSLVHLWIGKRLEYGTVMIDLPDNGIHSFEIRTAASVGNAGNADCDMALLVIPPFFGDDDSQNAYSTVTFPQVDGVASRAILCLDNGSNQTYANVVEKLLSSVPQDVPFIQVGEELRADVFDLSLENASDALLQSFVATTSSESDDTRGALVRLPISQLASRCTRSALWRDGIHPGTNEEHLIMDRTRGVLVAMLAELKTLSASYRRGTWSNWPAREFVNSSGVVPNYFGDGVDLPADWKDSLSPAEVEPAVMKIYKELDGCSFLAMIDSKTMNAPEQVKQDCREMLAKRQFRRCFEYILLWGESSDEPSAEEEETVVYLPKQSVVHVVEGCIRRMSLNDDDNDFTLPEMNAGEQLESLEEADENVFAVELMQAMRSPQLLLEQSTPRAVDSLAIDDSQPLVESTRTPDSNIMSPLVGVQTPATPAAGVDTPATLPQSTDFVGGSKRLLDSPGELTSSPKRRRGLSKNQKDSMAFTKKLESMLQGETVSDIKVGNVKLADLLRNAPNIEQP